MKKLASAAVLAAFAGSLLVLLVPSFAASSGETQLAQTQPAPKKEEKKKDKKEKKEKKEKSKKDEAPKKKKGEDKKKA